MKEDDMPDFDSIQIGDNATLSHTITEADVETYARLTGDNNPLHLDSEYAGNTKFGRRVVHGMLVASFISTMVGTVFPGEGALYLGQEVKFRKPVFIDDIIQVRAEVTQKVESSRMLEMKTVITNQSGETVITGKARVTWTR